MAGYVFDNFDPNLIWYASGIFSFIAILAYLLLHVRVGDRFRETAEKPQSAPVGGD